MSRISGALQSNARRKRARIFRKSFLIDENTKILDLGSETGTNIKKVLEGSLAKPENVYIADIDKKMVETGARLHGFVPIVLDEDGMLPIFEDGYFDIVYCSSVIEHVTIPKEEIWSCLSGKKFKERSLKKQKEFAREIKRLGKQYFVQTPYKYFPIESHTWLPFISIFPRPILAGCIKFSNMFWIKKTSPDWNLLNRSEFRSLFSEAEFVEEKLFGLTKSLMAIKSSSSSNR